MHLIRNYSHYLGGFLTTSHTDKSAEEFQKAISQGNVDVITQLGKENLLSAPLPNGELPLNYAVRQSQQASVHALLQLGANPTICDDQQLSAISTAYFKGSPQLIEELLHFVTQDMEIGREILGEGAPSKQALRSVKRIQTLHQSILDYLSKGSNKYIDKDKTLQAMINNLVREEPINDITKTFANSRESYLHVAVLTGNIKILEKLLENTDFNQLKKYLNCTNLTPLHYAAALGRLDMMKMLVDAGAIVRADNHFSSPFALLAAQLSQQSPLAISKYDAVLFFCSMALWSAQLLPSPQMTPNPHLLQFLQLANYSPLIFNFDKSAILYPLLSFIGMNASYLSPSLNSVSLAVSTVLTMKLAYQTFQGLRGCWRNSSLGYGKALLKSVVVHAPKTILSLNQLQGLGKTLGIVNSTTASPLQEIDELNKRDLKCLQRSLQTEQFATHCFKRSLDIYSTCSVDSNSNECATALKSYNDYFRRADDSTYPLCQFDSGGNWGKDETNRFQYCQDKRFNWKDKCYTLFDSQLNPFACEEAEKAFEIAKNNGFSPDYEEIFWRKIFMNEYRNFDCSANCNTMGDCSMKYKIWKGRCSVDDNRYQNHMNLEYCKEAENSFRKGVKEGFALDYEQDDWRMTFMRDHYQHICSTGGTIVEDCTEKHKNWRIECRVGYSHNSYKDSMHSDTCKKAEASFRNGLKHGFAPNKPQAQSQHSSQDSSRKNQKQSNQNSYNSGNGNSKQSPRTQTQDYTKLNLILDEAACKNAVKEFTGNKDSSFRQVRKIYLKKVLSEHPDKNPGNPEANANFAKISTLYEFITKCKDNHLIT